MEKLNLDNLIIDSNELINESNDVVTFSVNDDKLDQLLNDFHKRELGFVNIQGDDYYTLPQRDFDRFIDAADSKGYDVDYENNEDSVISIMESESAHTSTEPKTQPLLQIDKHEMDEVLAEWFYRLPKGYAEEPYSDADLYVLEQCIHEFRNGGFKPVINEARVETKLTRAGASFMQKVEDNGSIRDEAYRKIRSIVSDATPAEQTKWNNLFQSYTLKQYVANGWENFKEFFDIAPQGMGRGEMMAVLAIKGASSGGTEQKDLILPSATWEVKEDPDNIRMAKSGFSGKFKYVKNNKKFYELLENIGLNGGEDATIIENLNKVFNSEKIAADFMKILTVNFRGDGFKIKKKKGEEDTSGENFFDRVSKSAELPSGVIDLHYTGYKALNKLRTSIIKNKDLINTAKLIIQTSKAEGQFFISTDDASKIQKAKPDQEVNIKISTPAKQDIRTFLYNILSIIKSPMVENPELLPQDFNDRKYAYFADDQLPGFVYYLSGEPKPYLGYPKDFVIYGISQNMGKMMLGREASKYEFIKAQQALG